MYSIIKTPSDIYKYHIPLIAKDWDIEHEGGKCNIQCPTDAWYFLPAKMEKNIYWRGPPMGYNASYWNDGLTRQCKYLTTIYHEEFPGFCEKHKCRETHQDEFPLRHISLNNKQYMAYVIYEDMYDGAEQDVMFQHDLRVYHFSAGKKTRQWETLGDYLEEHDAIMRRNEIRHGCLPVREI